MVKFDTSFPTLSGKSLVMCAVLVASLTATSSAAAQEEIGQDNAAASAAEALPKGDPSSSLYWAEMRDVYTVQKRAFEKEGRFSLTLYGGLIPNNIFEQYIPLGLRANYFILENIGIELATSYAFTAKTSLEDTVRDGRGINAQAVLIGDTQLSHTNFGIVWSPFYGKAAFYDSKVIYFDMYLFGGAGMVVTQTTPDFNFEPDTEVKPEGVLGAGMAVYFGRHLGARIDYRQFVFQKVAGIGGVANPSEVSLGVSWFF